MSRKLQKLNMNIFTNNDKVSCVLCEITGTKNVITLLMRFLFCLSWKTIFVEYAFLICWCRSTKKRKIYANQQLHHKNNDKLLSFKFMARNILCNLKPHWNEIISWAVTIYLNIFTTTYVWHKGNISLSVVYNE